MNGCQTPTYCRDVGVTNPTKEDLNHCELSTNLTVNIVGVPLNFSQEGSELADATYIHSSNTGDFGFFLGDLFLLSSQGWIPGQSRLAEHYVGTICEGLKLTLVGASIENTNGLNHWSLYLCRKIDLPFPPSQAHIRVVYTAICQSSVSTSR